MKLSLKYHTAYLTIGTLMGLALGFALGLISGPDESGRIVTAAELVDPAIEIWLRALRFFAVLLASAFLLSAISTARVREGTGKLAGTAALQHLGVLTVGAIVSFSAIPLLDAFPDLHVDALLSSFGTPSSAEHAEAASLTKRLGQLFENPVSAVRTGNVLAIIIWSVLLGFALSFAPKRFRDPAAKVFARVTELALVAIQWLLLFMPVAILYVLFNLTKSGGLQLAGSVGLFLVVMSSIMIVVTILLYLWVWVRAQIEPRDFAKAMAPVYALAVGSRSSLICLPLEIESAKSALNLPPSIYEFVLPLLNTTMKCSKISAHPFGLFFLASLYGIRLDVIVVAIFVLGLYQISFVSSGLPSGGAMFSMPLFLAAGIPLEGYLFMKAVDIVPDMFKTMVNVTEDVALAATTATITERSAAEKVTHALGV